MEAMFESNFKNWKTVKLNSNEMNNFCGLEIVVVNKNPPQKCIANAKDLS